MTATMRLARSASVRKVGTPLVFLMSHVDPVTQAGALPTLEGSLIAVVNVSTPTVND